MAELAPEDLIQTLRRPKQVFTDAYLNDPITFNTDARFLPETVLKQLNEVAIVERDGTEYMIVDMNATEPQYYPIHMAATEYNRSDYLRTVSKTFTELVRPE
jgi:hypothetical protein